jgi:hypothetical protein
LGAVCSKVQDLKEISKVMAFDNVSFFEARRNLKGNQLMTVEGPIRSIMNFPALKYTSRRNFGVGLNDRNSTSFGSKKNSRGQEKMSFADPVKNNPKPSDQIFKLAEAIKSISDADKLWSRIWNTVSLHLSMENPDRMSGARPHERLSGPDDAQRMGRRNYQREDLWDQEILVDYRKEF